MNTLLHLCKKDFTFAKPWILGTWLAFVISNLLPWISPAGQASLPFMMIRLLAPAVMIFLASARIIHCDSFVGTAGFMGTRPLRTTTLLRNKLLLIALVLVLPAVGFALLHAACLRVNLSASDYLLLFIENWLYFSLIAGAAVAFAVISRNVGIMVIFIIATPSLFLMLLALFNLNWPFGKSIEEQHLRDSYQLVAQAVLSIAALSIAMNWVAMRRIWLTAAGFLLCATFLVAPGLFWKWNFVDDLSKDATAAEIFTDRPALKWLEAPEFGSNRSRENIDYSQVSRAGKVTGLHDGWTGKLVKFQSEARFADGTVWASEGDSGYDPFGRISPVILPQLGIQITENPFMRLIETTHAWTLFDCEKNRLQGVPDRRASIQGTGTFQLEQPVILAELPAQAGASAVRGRFKYRVDSVNPSGGEIHVNFSIRGVALTSQGDGAKEFHPVELLWVNPITKEFTQMGSGGTSGAGSEWSTIHNTFSINQESASPTRPNAKEFLKDARLYILGTRYGGTVRLPFEMRDIELKPGR